MERELTSVSAVDIGLYGQIYRASGFMASSESPIKRVQLVRSERLSGEADIWLASEIGQTTGSYKIRGAYNFMMQNELGDSEAPIVTASAGNHANAVALCARSLGQRAVIYMPKCTPASKVESTKKFGGDNVDVELEGDTFDDSYELARDYQDRCSLPFIHPFDDELVIAGQGTLGIEIADSFENIDAVYCPVGGGGLLSGIGTVLRMRHREVELVGVEPNGASSLKHAFDNGSPAPLPYTLDTYVEGAAVKQLGNRTYGYLEDLDVRPLAVKNRPLREAVTKLWRDGMRCELAGGLAVAAAERELGNLAGKTVVCVVSGGNLSVDRYQRDVKIS